MVKNERGISFEDIVHAVNSGGLIADYKHPNDVMYPNQFVMVVALKKYIYVVPYVEDTEKRFLKTIYPSRKAKKSLEIKGGAYEKNKI